MNQQQDELTKGLNMIADAIEHGALLPPGMVDTVRRGASEIGELYHALKFERQENGAAFLARLATQGGVIVSSSECSEMEIADARARDDFYVDADGLGYVLRLKRWLDLVKQRDAALHSIAQNTCCDRCQEAALVAQTSLGVGANVGAGGTSPEKPADTSRD